MKNTLLKITLLFALVTFSVPAKADIWCTLFGLGCPPATQSVDTDVPRSVAPNAKGLSSTDQAAAMIAYLDAHLFLKSSGPAFIPPVYGVAAPPPVKYNGVMYYYLQVSYPNSVTLNLGLVIDKFSRYPASPGYVLNTIANEIGTTIVVPAQTVPAPQGTQVQ